LLGIGLGVGLVLGAGLTFAVMRALAPAAPDGAVAQDGPRPDARKDDAARKDAPPGDNATRKDAAPGDRAPGKDAAPADKPPRPDPPTAGIDLARLKAPQPMPFGWKSSYDAGARRWTFESSQRPDRGAAFRMFVDLPADAPADADACAAQATQKDALEPGWRLSEVAERGALPDGFVVKGPAVNDAARDGKPGFGFVAVRTINGVPLRARSAQANVDAARQDALELFKKLQLPTSTLFALQAPGGWAMTPDNVTLIVSQPEKAQLAYFDTVADRELQRVDLDFKPGALALQGDTLFVAAQGGSQIYALDRATGKVKKQYNLGGQAVSQLACHPSQGMLYATTNAFGVYSIDPASGAVTRTAARGHHIAVDPEGKYVYTGLQPPDRGEVFIEEGPNGSLRIYSDRWGKRALLFKYLADGVALRFVSGQNNAAVNGWAMHLTPDGKRLMLVGGAAGGRPRGTGPGAATSPPSTVPTTWRRWSARRRTG
jgi:hypothetical protein